MLRAPLNEFVNIYAAREPPPGGGTSKIIAHVNSFEFIGKPPHGDALNHP